jgi:hypothetical protein
MCVCVCVRERERERGGDAGAARSPARSPLLDEMEDVE